MTPLILYRQQAAKELAAAESATLDNVRDRSRRAAAAWTKLALQIEHANELRATRAVVVDSDEDLSADNESSDRCRATSLLMSVDATKPDAHTTKSNKHD